MFIFEVKTISPTIQHHFARRKVKPNLHLQPEQLKLLKPIQLQLLQQLYLQRAKQYHLKAMIRSQVKLR